jgi:hypothetical protein
MCGGYCFDLNKLYFHLYQTEVNNPYFHYVQGAINVVYPILK